MKALSLPHQMQSSNLIKKIQDAKSLLLTTHKQCDGDGLGAQLGLYHSLKKMDKDVRVMCVDDVPKKYRFLDYDKYLEVYERPHKPIEETDLALIFDTNDRRLVEPLFSELEKKCKDILFIDHHPTLNQGPEPTLGSYIDTSAASTGEIAYFIIKTLGVRLDEKIARALYTSIAFDTQIFRYVKSSPVSHLIAAELLEYEKNAEEIHRSLFATHTIDKIGYLSKVLSEVEFFADGRIAIIRLSRKDLKDFNLDMDDSRDVIDMIMNIKTLQVAALFREEEKDTYKLSLRSKGEIEILSIAENFQGGGHMFASGALIKGPFKEIKEKVVSQFLNRLDAS
ncbi:MAG: bifunctional oligoribonuclease/PAP phosphatase NrnA [Bdellovibrio sp.]|nr:MAG: bifunctional oligoribonuclease/PAP phosphatase NrnA [Bdellovibrio sp.]